MADYASDEELQALLDYVGSSAPPPASPASATAVAEPPPGPVRDDEFRALLDYVGAPAPAPATAPPPVATMPRPGEEGFTGGGASAAPPPAGASLPVAAPGLGGVELPLHDLSLPTGPGLLAGITPDTPVLGGIGRALGGAGERVGRMFSEIGADVQDNFQNITNVAGPHVADALGRPDMRGRAVDPVDVGPIHFAEVKIPEKSVLEMVINPGASKGGGWEAVPAAAGDLISADFLPIKAFSRFGEAARDLAGAPATGLVAAATWVPLMNLGDVLGDIGKGYIDWPKHLATQQTALGMLTDPTRAQRAMNAEWRRLYGDIPILGWVGDNILTSGEALNPINYIGLGGIGRPGRFFGRGLLAATEEGLPAVHRVLSAINYADAAVARSLALPITLPLKGAGALTHLPGLNKLFDLTLEAKVIQRTNLITRAAQSFVSNGGDNAALGLIAKGNEGAVSGILGRMPAELVGPLREYAAAVGQALAKSGGKLDIVAETEFTHAIHSAVAKSLGYAPTTDPFTKIGSFITSTIKEGWLGVSPSYHGQNILTNIANGLLHGFAPMLDGAYLALRRRYGMASTSGGFGSGKGFSQVAYGSGGLWSRLPVIGQAVRASRAFGEWAERQSHNGGNAAGMLRHIAENQGKAIDAAIDQIAAKYPGLDPALLSYFRDLGRNHAGSAGELFALARGGRNPFLHIADFGDSETVFHTIFERFHAELDTIAAQIGNGALDPASLAAAKRLTADTIKRVQQQAKRVAQTTPVPASVANKVELGSHAQVLGILSDPAFDNAHRLADAMHALRVANEWRQLVYRDAAQRASANPAQAAQIWMDRHESSTLITNALHEALAFMRSHTYAQNAAGIPQGEVHRLAGIFANDVGDEVARTQGLLAGRPGPSATSLATIFDDHYASLNWQLDSLAASMLQTGFLPQNGLLRGGQFWANFMRSAVDQEAAAIAANRGNAMSLAAGAVKRLEAFSARLDNLPQQWAALRQAGLADVGPGAMLPQSGMQREIARALSKAYGEMLNEAEKAGTELAEKALFNYSMTTNFDKLLGAISPFTVWQTRNLPLWAEMMASRPGLYGAVSEYQRVAVPEEGQPPSFNGFVRTTPLDGPLSHLVGRPLSAFSNPAGALLGGFSQTDQPPFMANIPPDQRTALTDLGQGLSVYQWASGGTSLWPWFDIGLKVAGAYGRTSQAYSYGDMLAPSRFLRGMGIDPESVWKSALAKLQGFDSETGDPWTDLAIQRRIVEIGEEEGLDRLTLYRALGDRANPLHKRAREETEKERYTVAQLRYLFPIGIKTVSPGREELDRMTATYFGLGEKSLMSDYIKQHPILGPQFARNDSRQALVIEAGLAERQQIVDAAGPRVKKLYDDYYGLGDAEQREFIKRYPEDYQLVRNLTAKLREWAQRPDNALAAQYWADAGKAQGATGVRPTTDQWLQQRDLPTKKLDEDLNSPFQALSEALARGAAQKEQAYQRDKDAFYGRVQQYYELGRDKQALLDQWGQMPDGRAKNDFARASGLFDLFDRQDAWKDAHPDEGRYLQWVAARKKEGKPDDLDTYLVELAAGRVPAYKIETQQRPAQATNLAAAPRSGGAGGGGSRGGGGGGAPRVSTAARTPAAPAGAARPAASSAGGSASPPRPATVSGSPAPARPAPAPRSPAPARPPAPARSPSPPRPARSR